MCTVWSITYLVYMWPHPLSIIPLLPRKQANSYATCYKGCRSRFSALRTIKQTNIHVCIHRNAYYITRFYCYWFRRALAVSWRSSRNDLIKRPEQTRSKHTYTLTRSASSPFHRAAVRSWSSITYIFMSNDCFIHEQMCLHSYAPFLYSKQPNELHFPECTLTQRCSSLSAPPPSPYAGVKFHSSDRPEGLEWQSGRPIEATEKCRVIYYQRGITSALMFWRARHRLKDHLERLWNTRRFCGCLRLTEAVVKVGKWQKQSLWKLTNFFVDFYWRSFDLWLSHNEIIYIVRFLRMRAFLWYMTWLYCEKYKKYTFLGKIVRNR